MTDVEIRRTKTSHRHQVFLVMCISINKHSLERKQQKCDDNVHINCRCTKAAMRAVRTRQQKVFNKQVSKSVLQCKQSHQTFLC